MVNEFLEDRAVSGNWPNVPAAFRFSDVSSESQPSRSCPHQLSGDGQPVRGRPSALHADRDGGCPGDTLVDVTGRPEAAALWEKGFPVSVPAWVTTLSLTSNYSCRVVDMLGMAAWQRVDA
jgi:hypothetical protein